MKNGILKDIDNYYNTTKNSSINKNRHKLTGNFIISFDKKNKQLLYLKNDNTVMYSALYNFYGVLKNDRWTWANNIDGISNNIIKHIDELRTKKQLFKNYKKSNEMEFYYNFLSNESIVLKTDTDKKLINKLLIYLNNDIIMLNPKNSSGSIQFIGLNKLLENYV
jgi:hypothetical protein